MRVPHEMQDGGVIINAIDLLSGPWGGDLCEQYRYRAATGLVGTSPTGDLLSDLLAAAVDGATIFNPNMPPPNQLAEERAAQPDLIDAASSLIAQPETAWWSAGLVGPQFVVQASRTQDPAPMRPIRTGRDALDAWREGELKQNRVFRDMPVDSTMLTGDWWSAPLQAASTAPAHPDRGPLGLWLAEEGTMDRSAWVVAARPTSAVRVYEIDGTAAWARLVTRYPLDVTDGKGPDWNRYTGVSARWLVPDWVAVSDDYDAVHLTIWGWLCTAGCAPLRCLLPPATA